MKNSGKNTIENPKNGGNNKKSSNLAPVNHNKMKKNRNRLGGGGLSLQAFANAKSKNDGYNPALIKKQREFYKNAKYVNKYKKIQKQPNQGQSFSQATKPIEGTTSEDREVDERRTRKPKKAYRLEEIYRQKREEEEKARMEKDAIIKSKKEEKEKSQARRKAQKEKMLKRTRSGQPVMKYRIEQLLQTIQSSKNSQ